MRAYLPAMMIACACSSTRNDPPATGGWVVLDARRVTEADLRSAVVHPKAAARRLVVRNGVLRIELSRSPGEIRVEVPGACPVRVEEPPEGRGSPVRRHLVPLVDFGGPYENIGFGKTVTLDIRPNCAEGRGRIEWHHADGSPPAGLSVEDRGYRVDVRTPVLESLVGSSLPWGVVPLSPRTRGRSVLEARLVRPDGHDRSYRVAISPAPRARGLPNVAVGQRLVLGGRGWQLIEQPPGAAAALEPRDAWSTLTPRARGRHVLRDAEGSTLQLQAGRYGDTPLDCGRAECHRQQAAAVTASPMTRTYHRALSGGAHGPSHPRASATETATCILGCHTTGEPGLDDGGFSDVLARIGLTPPAPAPDAWKHLPRDARRLGGVGCLACHGPGAVPEPSARYDILRSDVCAYCHDAPPRYGHVEAWRSSSMATADRSKRTREEPHCAECHTTAGFLSAIGASSEPRIPPDRVSPLGIACPACHAVHSSESGPALLRPVPVPAPLQDAMPPSLGSSRVCLGCHAPAKSTTWPEATAAVLWLGRGGLDPETGTSLEGPRSHARIQGGCVGCHDGGPLDLERGTRHGFRAIRNRCEHCHDDHEGDGSHVRARAAALWRRLEKARHVPQAAKLSLVGEPPHASPSTLDTTDALGRAAFDVLVVLEDPAARHHAPIYAERLLDAAEKTLDERTPTGATR